MKVNTVYSNYVTCYIVAIDSIYFHFVITRNGMPNTSCFHIKKGNYVVSLGVSRRSSIESIRHMLCFKECTLEQLVRT
jgi:hypothetical protein